MGRTDCTEPHCLYKGALYLTVELYLYSPYGSYGLYRSSVLVQGCTLPYSRVIPLLPLRAVRPITDSQGLYKGALYVYLFLYLYRVIKKSLCTWRLQYNHQMHRDFLIILNIPIRTTPCPDCLSRLGVSNINARFELGGETEHGCWVISLRIAEVSGSNPGSEKGHTYIFCDFLKSPHPNAMIGSRIRPCRLSFAALLTVRETM
jgi:hypothetical protein